MNRTVFHILISIVLLAGMLILVGLTTAITPASAQTMPPTPNAERLKAWPTVFPPSQADDGAQVYYQVCMVCHGDYGQGLTEEWRSVLEIPDRDCWQSGCHNPHHAPGGFVFPKIVPRVVGPGAMARYATALDLYTFLSTKMPWQDPGSLSTETYWNLTAYLLRENKVDFGGRVLDETSAAQVRVNPQIATATPIAAGGGSSPLRNNLLALAAVLIVIGFFVAGRLIRRNTDQ